MSTTRRNVFNIHEDGKLTPVFKNSSDTYKVGWESDEKKQKNISFKEYNNYMVDIIQSRLQEEESARWQRNYDAQVARAKRYLDQNPNVYINHIGECDDPTTLSYLWDRWG